MPMDWYSRKIMSYKQQSKDDIADYIFWKQTDFFPKKYYPDQNILWSDYSDLVFRVEV